MSHLVMQEVHTLTFKIDTTPGSQSPTMSRVGAGIDNMQEALNEVVQQYKFMTDEGYSRSRVTAMAPVWTLSGRRIWGDAAQDFIFSKKYDLGANRETTGEVSWTANGYDYKLEFDCTFANLQEIGGATEEDSAITIEIHIDGKPTFTKTAVTP